MAQEMEERIAHLERMVDDLSEMVALQGREIARMDHLLEALRQRVQAQADAEDGAVILGDERPPHY